MVLKTIGDRIRKARERMGLTQLALGKLCGYAQITISQYECNYREPGAKTIEKLASHLNTTAVWLYFGVHEPIIEKREINNSK